jgi:hypothetical protein
MHAYSIIDQSLLVEDDVVFSQHNAIYNCAHTLGSSELYFWIPGDYLFYTNVYHIEPCQFSLMLNNIVVLPGSTIGSPTGSSQNSTGIIVSIKQSDLTEPNSDSPSGFAARINLRNHSSFVPSVTINGSGGSGSAPNQVTATLTAFLLREYLLP